MASTTEAVGMRIHWAWLILGILVCFPDASRAEWPLLPYFIKKNELNRLNRRLAGQVVDHTANHGFDRRFYSQALGEYRDLYVYLPPGYDPQRRYPVMFWMHAYSNDECDFLRTVAPQLDMAMARGELQPLILVAIDGTVSGGCRLIPQATFFTNSRLGRFEDHVMDDVWDFVHERYSVDPDRSKHVMGGASMGGSAAYRMGIRHRDRIGHVLGIFPALNLRYMDCRGGMLGNFHPECDDLREDFSQHSLAAARYFGFIPVPVKILLRPMINPRRARDFVSNENPYELLDTLDLKPGELGMFAAYGTRDQFNMDAQVESFEHRARQKGLEMTVIRRKGARHDRMAALSFVPDVVAWLRERLDDDKGAAAP